MKIILLFFMFTFFSFNAFASDSTYIHPGELLKRHTPHDWTHRPKITSTATLKGGATRSQLDAISKKYEDLMKKQHDDHEYAKQQLPLILEREKQRDADRKKKSDDYESYVKKTKSDFESKYKNKQN